MSCIEVFFILLNQVYELLRMQLIFLGTAACYPTPLRGLSGTVLKFNDGSCWLFNCGEGTQIQLQKSCVKLGKITKIFISHLQSDQLFGLPGLLCTISACRSDHPHPPLEIYGPKGLRHYLRVNLALSRSLYDFSYIVHELDLCTEQLPQDWNDWNVLLEAQNVVHPNEEIGHLIKRNIDDAWHVYEDDHVTVTANWLQHQVPSYGYVIHEKPLPGNLDISKLEAFSLHPGPLCALLKKGECVSNGYGRIISPSEVLGKPRPGRKIALIGDTTNSEAMKKIACNVDVLVHEVTLQDRLKEKTPKKCYCYTPDMAATFAKDIKARQLILTNFTQPQITKTHDKLEDQATNETMVYQANSIFNNGRIIAVEDFTVMNIPLKKPPKN